MITNDEEENGGTIIEEEAGDEVDDIPERPGSAPPMMEAHFDARQFQEPMSPVQAMPTAYMDMYGGSIPYLYQDPSGQLVPMGMPPPAVAGEEPGWVATGAPPSPGYVHRTNSRGRRSRHNNSGPVPPDSPTYEGAPMRLPGWSPLLKAVRPLAASDDSVALEDPLLPDLSSDPEPFSSEIDYQQQLMEAQMKFSHQGPANPEYSRILWEAHETPPRMEQLPGETPEQQGTQNPTQNPDQYPPTQAQSRYEPGDGPPHLYEGGDAPPHVVPPEFYHLPNGYPMGYPAHPQAPYPPTYNMPGMPPANVGSPNAPMQAAPHPSMISPVMGGMMGAGMPPMSNYPQGMVRMPHVAMPPQMIPMAFAPPPMGSQHGRSRDMGMYHSEEQGSTSPSGNVCRFFLQGNCSRGNRCGYSHIANNGYNRDKGGRSGRGTSRRGRGGGSPQSKKVAPATDLANRYTSIDQVMGNIYNMCKDQHGCRFLQKKLEEQNPRLLEIIFDEVYDHIVELMTDPFGNYLCQKLLEYSNDKQRHMIVEKVAPSLVSISKNMHGTRAVQKLIECLSSTAQIQLVIQSLSSAVVLLIQDLNGNHVIQRCLNRLSSEDNQFVYNAVAQHCVEVACHRHGCCVMQRCIDHGSEAQKMQLVAEISRNSLYLVQDPFGNYVVQYVLELPVGPIKRELISHFYGHLPSLSTQKFSSNVIEKCLKSADLTVRQNLISELCEGPNLGELLRDPYGNYVVQTALTVADPILRKRLVAAIRPLLPDLPNTPYGKRIQNKMMKLDNLE